MTADINVVTPPPSDIAVTSASTDDAKSVNLNYTISGSDLSQPFQVGIYRSTTPTFDYSTAVPTGIQATIPSTDSNGTPSTAQGSHTVVVNLPSAIGPDTSGQDPYVFVVANPPGGNHIPESDDTNDTNDVAPLALPQITLNSTSWDSQQGGVDFSYQVQGGALPAGSAVDFYWASGPTEADELGGPVYSLLASGLAAGGSGTVPPGDLATPPTGAAYLLAVAHSGPADAKTDSVIPLDAQADLVPTDLSVDYVLDPTSPLALVLLLQSPSNSNVFQLNVTATVENSGHLPSGAFKVAFYGGSGPGTQPGDADYGVLSDGFLDVPSLAPGQSTQVSATINSPVLLTSGSGPKYSGVYYVGVFANAGFLVPESDESNNTLSENQSARDAVSFSTALHDTASIWQGIGLTSASANLYRYLDGDGSTYTYGPYSPTAYEITDSAAFATVDQATKQGLASLMTQQHASGSLMGYAVPVPTRLSYSGTTGLITDTDLALAIGGTQANSTGPAASATFSGNVRVSNGKHVTVEYDGTLQYTFRDKYEFDNDDYLKSGFDAIARVLADLGVAKPYDVNYVVEVPVKGVLHLS
jgi:hypothetical protein